MLDVIKYIPFLISFSCFGIPDSSFLVVRKQFCEYSEIDDFENMDAFTDSICYASVGSKNPNLKFFCLHFTALKFRLTGKLERAIVERFKAIHFLEENLPERSDYLTLSYYGVAQTYKLIPDIENHVKYHEKALIFSKQADNYLAESIQSNLAVAYLTQGDSLKAYQHQKAALYFLDNSTPIENWNYPLIRSLYKHRLYCMSGNKDSSIYYGKQMITLATANRTKKYFHYYLAESLLSFGDTVLAIHHFEKAFSYGQKNYVPRQTRDLASNLSKLYLYQKKADKALHYLTIVDSLKAFEFSPDKVKKISEVEQKYASTNKDDSELFSNYFLYGLIAILLILALGMGLLFHRRKQTKDQRITKESFVLSEKVFKEIDYKIHLAIADKLFLDRNCSLNFLCEKLNIKSTRYLTEYIRKKHERTFPQFISDLRFDFMKSQLNNSSFIKMSADEKARYLGFGSTRSFRNFIKERTGKSVTDYFKQ